MVTSGEPYLDPYVRAAQKHGGNFASLLWASPRTQSTRFEAIRQMQSPRGLRLLDAGCGRADLLTYLADCDERPREYIGLEAVDALADAAMCKHLGGATIVRGDFVADPGRLFVGADLIVFSGSLNTLPHAAFYSTIRRAYDAAGTAVVFNFLSSDYLAGRAYLYWRSADDVLSFARTLSGDVRIKSDYLKGDCTLCLRKPGELDDSEIVHA